MCIRDRCAPHLLGSAATAASRRLRPLRSRARPSRSMEAAPEDPGHVSRGREGLYMLKDCLLYTSDAADDM
eukprot:12944800-Alexandrium_andersonii.AAC.1